VEALRQIVPIGWKAYAQDDGVKNIPHVQWSAAKTDWTAVLNQVMMANGLRAVINWDKKEIDFASFDRGNAQTDNSKL
jgi:hypothetical protein